MSFLRRINLDEREIETLRRVLASDVQIRNGEPRAAVSSAEREASAALNVPSIRSGASNVPDDERSKLRATY